nr:putative ribonuclease h protein [Quercus suber]
MENSNNGGWADVLRKKYMSGRASKQKAHSRTWKAVKIGRSICEKGSKWSVGCNSQLNFWNDKWLNVGTIRSLIEGPLNLGESEVCIQEVTTEIGWDLTNLSFVFPNCILNAVRAIPLRRFAEREDHRSWISSLNGEFDPKNAYLLAIDDNLETSDFHGKWIWKLQSLPKIKIFLWKCLHMSLPVKAILAYRGFGDLGGCDSCTELDESIIHVLRECPIAKNFWVQSSCPISLKQSFSDDLVTWIKKNALDSFKAHGKDYRWCNFFLLGLWNLWLQRNNKAFRHQSLNPNLVQVVEMQTRELMYCVLEPDTGKESILRQVQWLKPAVGWHKLNTDGSVVSSCGLAGCGGLLRDCAGQWIVGFAKSIVSSSSIAAELWALREGLGLCLDRGILAVEVELDASAAISLVTSNVKTNGDLSGLVDDCRELLMRLPQVKLVHCYREANFCADALAKLGSASINLSSVFVSPPPVILQFLYEDMLGFCRSRRCTTGAAASVS